MHYNIYFKEWSGLIKAIYGDVPYVLIGDDQSCFLVWHSRLVQETRSKVVVLEGEVQVRENARTDKTNWERASVLDLKRAGVS